MVWRGRSLVVYWPGLVLVFKVGSLVVYECDVLLEGGFWFTIAIRVSIGISSGTVF